MVGNRSNCASIVIRASMGAVNEIQRRRTFAIINHPDAGKTTLTEKFLLFGGAIQTAGAVKNNKITKTQHRISWKSSANVDFGGYLGHGLPLQGPPDQSARHARSQRFAEDTYRTLTFDSVILVVDCVKGVEAQTERLMEVCRMHCFAMMSSSTRWTSRVKILLTCWMNSSYKSKCAP